MSRPVEVAAVVALAVLLGAGAFAVTRTVSSPFLGDLINRSGLVLVASGFLPACFFLVSGLVQRARAGARDNARKVQR